MRERRLWGELRYDMNSDYSAGWLLGKGSRHRLQHLFLHLSRLKNVMLGMEDKHFFEIIVGFSVLIVKRCWPYL